MADFTLFRPFPFSVLSAYQCCSLSFFERPPASSTRYAVRPDKTPSLWANASQQRAYVEFPTASLTPRLGQPEPQGDSPRNGVSCTARFGAHDA